jgi:hypothetical protein
MVSKLRKYNIPEPFNLRYSRAKAQALFRKQEWAFTDESWYKVWKDSGVMQHMGNESYHYCMVRAEDTEAHGPHNCLIIPRRMHYKKLYWTYIRNFPKVDYNPVKHGYYVPPETLERFKDAE